MQKVLYIQWHGKIFDPIKDPRVKLEAKMVMLYIRECNFKLLWWLWPKRMYLAIIFNGIGY